MEYAEISNGEKIVRIDSRTSEEFRSLSRNSQLRCCCCKQRVTYVASGYNRKSHFKHQHGNASSQCDLYHPFSGLSNVERHEHRAINAPQSLNYFSPEKYFDISLSYNVGRDKDEYFTLQIESKGFEEEHEIIVFPKYGNEKIIKISSEKKSITLIVDFHKPIIKTGSKLLSEHSNFLNHFIDSHRYLILNEDDKLSVNLSEKLDIGTTIKVYDKEQKKFHKEVDLRLWKSKLISDGYAFENERNHFKLWPENIINIDLEERTFYVSYFSEIKIINTSFESFSCQIELTSQKANRKSLYEVYNPGSHLLSINSSDVDEVHISNEHTSYKIIRDSHEDYVFDISGFSDSTFAPTFIANRAHGSIIFEEHEGIWKVAEELNDNESEQIKYIDNSILSKKEWDKVILDGYLPN